MLSSKWRALVLVAILGQGHTWNIFPPSMKHSVDSFAKDKLSNLKSLRQRLETYYANQTFGIASAESSVQAQEASNLKASPPNKNETSSPLEGTKNGLKETRETLLEQILPIPSKEELLNKVGVVGDKFVEMKERMEPEVKKYLTEKYNSFLSNLVKHSETIGVPIYVINSLKIPQNLDPRLNLIKSVLRSGPINNIMESFQEYNKKKRSTNHPQGRSDDLDLVSDQEPDNRGRSQKYPHFYLSRNRPKPLFVSERNNGYQINGDQNDAYETSGTNEDYLEDNPYEASPTDLFQSAGTHVARGNSRGDYGHGGGGGGGGGGSSNGLTDPFTILGGLAFLTYLAMLIQQQMNTPAPTGKRRRMTADTLDIETLTDAISPLLAQLRIQEKLRGPGKGSFVTKHQIKFLEQLPKIFNTFFKKRNALDPTKPCNQLCQIMRKFKDLGNFRTKSNSVTNTTQAHRSPH